MPGANAKVRLSLAVTAVGLGLAACDASSTPGPSAPVGGSASSLTVTSKSFPSDLQIPVEYTCDGKNVSPQLTWSAPPDGTKALVVIADDLDASGGFTHWVALDLPPDALSLPEGADIAALGGRVGLNDQHNVQYDGPCPPRGSYHRYRFRVFASDRVLPLDEGATRSAVEGALAGHVLGVGSLVANFSH
ncbi:MAG TPA: YbhB/YbcL family Raf kinase inhibitor-like protein [Polyangiaceae bacterium]|jgi:hypothetical protein